MASMGPAERLARLQQLAAEWGLRDGSQASPITRPRAPQPCTYRTPNDDLVAEELLKRARTAGQGAAPGGIRRAFTTSKKRTWEPKEVYDALEAHVGNVGSPGVAEALIALLMSAGGSLQGANTKIKTTLLSRRKSLDVLEPGRILQKAVQNRQTDMVAVLLRHVDHSSLDSALPLAIRSGDLVVAQMLLDRGAKAAQTAAGQDAFQHMCMTGGQADLVALVLQSEGKPSPLAVSQAMVDASRQGCLETVQCLSQSTADGDHCNAQALKNAIAQCRVDIVLAILTGVRPPSSGSMGLYEAFSQLFEHPVVGPNEKLVLAEALLCAGASGDAVSAALLSAAETDFYPMVDLLVKHGASAEYQDAAVLRRAVARGRGDLVGLIVNETAVLSPIYAAECMEHLPKTVLLEDRHAILTALLRKGARGSALDDALIDAVESCDANSVDLLLNSQFPGGKPVVSHDGHDVRKRPKSMVYESHATASVDAKGGLALQIAALSGNVTLVQRLLQAKPSADTLLQIFPLLQGLSSVDRYHMTECFLGAGVSGTCVSEALRAAIDEHPPRRDDNLIDLLLQHKADVNFNDGAGISSAITHCDVNLLEKLLKSKPTIDTVSLALPVAIKVQDKLARFQMVDLLVKTGAGQRGPELSTALLEVLEVRPIDLQLAELLLQSGRADVNFDQGRPVMLALQDRDFGALTLVLEKGRPNAETLRRGLEMLCDMPTDVAKVAKADAIIGKTNREETLSGVLLQEVQNYLATPTHLRNMSVIKCLVAAGADVNAHKASALCVAVGAANTFVSDLLLACKPNPATLAAALPHSLHIKDATDRLTFTQKLIECGAPSTEANRALVHAVRMFPGDLALIILLAARADSSDGEALMAAVKHEAPDLVDALLRKAPQGYAAPVLSGVFLEASRAKDDERRVSMCTALLRAGVSGPVVSDALLAASSHGDMVLGTLLMQHGAKVDHQDGQAIVEASRAGALDVLQMLLSSEADIKIQMLAHAFQAATQIGDLKRRAEICRVLLERGVVGEVVHAQLISAARFGEEGQDLVRVLLEYGADVNYANGEAIWTATRSAILGSLKMLLGVESTGERQTKPNTLTLLRALKASRKLSSHPRYQVMEWLFEAGLPPSDDMHLALNKAVKNEPDPRLIRLLLKHGASPLFNGCETLIDAVQMLAVETLHVLMEVEMAPADTCWVFKQSYHESMVSSWFSETGFQIAKILVDKGAHGDALSPAFSVVIDSYGTDKDALARQFAKLLMGANVDVHYQGGIAMMKAAKTADTDLIRQLLARDPSTAEISAAFPCIFEGEVSEEDTLELITLFGDYRHGEQGLDAISTRSGDEPILFRALAKFPRSVRVLQTLLDAGYFYDQVSTAHVMHGVGEDEQVSLLFWALLQPQKRVSSNVIELLVARGAKVNFTTKLSRKTPLMLAIQSRRSDLVKCLILAGAEVDVTDATGNTPLNMATKIEGDLGTSIMSNVLAADPSKNDGSLHNAAGELNLRAVEILVDFGHDVDFPSPLHGGRSALGEVCLHAAHAGPLTSTQVKQMEKTMEFLMRKGADLSLQSDGKSVLLLALHSQDAVPTTRSLLKMGMWKHINNAYNNYNDGTYTYSPTQYVARVFSAAPQSDPDTKDQLLALLKANRGIDVYYAINPSGPQPEDAVGVPDELLALDRNRRARAERLAREADDHALQLARTHALADAHSEIMERRAALEDARRQRQAADEEGAMRAHAAVEDELFAAAVARRNIEREAALRHERLVGEEALTRARLTAEAEAEVRSEALALERRIGAERIGQARALADVRVSERREMERLDRARDARTDGRLDKQRLLVDSQANLAVNLAHGGLGRRQIGYVAGELD